MEERYPQVVENIGDLERAWKAVTDVAKRRLGRHAGGRS